MKDGASYGQGIYSQFDEDENLAPYMATY